MRFNKRTLVVGFCFFFIQGSMNCSNKFKVKINKLAHWENVSIMLTIINDRKSIIRKYVQCFRNYIRQFQNQKKYVCVCVCIYVCVYVRVYIYIYIYTVTGISIGYMLFSVITLVYVRHFAWYLVSDIS